MKLKIRNTVKTGWPNIIISAVAVLTLGVFGAWVVTDRVVNAVASSPHHETLQSNYSYTERYVRANDFGSGSSNNNVAVQVRTPMDATTIRVSFNGEDWIESTDGSNSQADNNLYRSGTQNGLQIWRIKKALAPGEYSATVEYKLDDVWYAVNGGPAKVFAVTVSTLDIQYPNDNRHIFRGSDDTIVRIKVSDKHKSFNRAEFIINEVKYEVNRNSPGVDLRQEGNYVLVDITKSPDWQPLPEGNYTATVNAWNKANGRSLKQHLKTRSFTIDNTSPIVSDFTAPDAVGSATNDGATIQTSIKATDASGINQVRFYLAKMPKDGKPRNNLTGIREVLGKKTSTDIYTASLDTNGLHGKYVLLVAARDNASHNTTPLFKTIDIDNKPVVKSISPDKGDIISGKNQRVDIEVSNPDFMTGGFLVLNKEIEGKIPNDNRTNIPIKRDDSGKWHAIVDTTNLVKYSERNSNGEHQGDGKYLFKVEAHGHEGSRGYLGNGSGWISPSFYFTVDNTAPSTPEITSPSPRKWFNTSSIVNSWTEAEDTNGISHYQVAYNYDDGHKFGGSTCPDVTISGTEGFIGCRNVNGLKRNHTPSKSEQGGVTIWVRAVDNAGNFSPWSKPVHYYHDSVNPETDIHVSKVAERKFTVNGTATDNVSLSRVYVQLVHRETSKRYGDTTIHLADKGKSGEWSVEYDTTKLPHGNYSAHVEAADKAGNRGAAGWTDSFLVDTTKPTVKLITPTGDKPTSGSLSIQVDATDETELAKIVANIRKAGEKDVFRSTQSTVSDKSATHNVTRDLPDGTYTIRYNALDKAGNVSQTHNQTVTIDQTNPVISLSENSDGNVSGHDSWKNARNVEVSIDDKNPGTTVLYRQDDSEIKNYTENKFNIGMGLPEGVYYLVHTDLADNPSDPKYFTISNKKPAVYNIGGLNEGYLNNIGNNSAEIAFSAGKGENSASDVNEVKIRGWEYNATEINNRGKTAFSDIIKGTAAGDYSFNLSEILGDKWIDGKRYIILVEVQNTADVHDQKFFDILVDISNPTGVLSYSNNGDPTNKKVIVTLEVDEDVEYIEGWKRDEEKSRKFTKEFTENEKFTVNFTDKAGNQGSVSGEVKGIDREAPAVKIDNISNLVFNAPNPVITGTVDTDAESIEIRIGDGDWRPVPGHKMGNTTWSFTVEQSQSGIYDLAVRARDILGNTSKDDTEGAFGQFTIEIQEASPSTPEPASRPEEAPAAPARTSGSASLLNSISPITVADRQAQNIISDTVPVFAQTLIAQSVDNSEADDENDNGQSVAAAIDNRNNSSTSQKPQNTDDGEVLSANSSVSNWSVVNVILAVLATLMSLAALPGLVRNKENQRIFVRLLTILPAAGAIVTVLSVENFSNPVGIVNTWTIIIAAIVIMQVIIVSQINKTSTK